MKQLKKVILLLIFSCLLLVFHSGKLPAAEGIGPASSSVASTGADVLKSITFSHTVESGNNRILIVGVSIANGKNQTVNRITYAGADLNRIGFQNNGQNCRIEMWQLVNPATGTNDIVVIMSATARFVAGASSFSGVHQSEPLGGFFSATGDSIYPTVNVTGVKEGEVVIDTIAYKNIGAGDPLPTPDPSQIRRWAEKTTSPGAKDNAAGGGSTEPGPAGGGAVAMIWNNNLGKDKQWAIGAVIIKPANPTAIKLDSFNAVGFGGGVLLKWRTGYEVDNLGFNIYREEGGNYHKLTPEIIAGSALLTGPKNGLRTGRSYSWWDSLEDGTQTSGLKYWLEDIDINGTRTLHGPVAVEASSEPLPKKIEAALFSQVGKSQKKFHKKPHIKKMSAKGGKLQWGPAAKEAVKFKVREEGWYQVGQPELIAAGLNPSVDPRFLHLYAEGVEQPIVVTGEDDGRFDPQDAIEFYATGIDSPFTDLRVYWLVEGEGRGKRVKVTNDKGGKIEPSSFPYTLEWDERTIYFAALKNGDKDNFFGPVVSLGPLNKTLNVIHPDPNPPENAKLEAALQGITAGPHKVKVMINNDLVGEVLFNDQAEGVATIAIPQEGLSEGENLLTLAAEGGEMDVSLVDYIRLTYWRTYTADGDTLYFTADGHQRVSVDGFSNPKIRAIDITDPESSGEVEGFIEGEEGNYSIEFTAPKSAQRSLLAFTEDQIKNPAIIVGNRSSSWHDTGHEADLVIISFGEFIDGLKPLKDLREAEGWSTALIDVEDIYDEFSFGEKTPEAIKDFLTYAQDYWQMPPRFVLLVGDASFDSHNYLGFGDFDLLPTKLIDTTYFETASDDWFVDFDEDGLPEMAIGRLPVRTAEETVAVVSKIIGYEKADNEGGWENRILLVVDKNDGFDFNSASSEIEAVIPQSISVQKISLSETDYQTAKSELMKRLNQGQLLVNYLGHGSVEIWRGGILTSDDTPYLTNGSNLPFFVSTTCLNGFFHDVYTDSLAEALIGAENGGAIAVFASSGFTEPEWQVVMNKELVRLLLNNKSLTIGEAAMQAKAVAEDQDVRKSWILFGDPTTRLK